jgi:ABC-2 type transport system ATP-binding protein
MSQAISISNLRKTYATGTEALKDVSLKIGSGEFYGLLGPNGAGKTTIIGIITGLVIKSDGKVSVFDVDIDSNPEKARSYIGVVPQELNFNIFEKVINIVVDQAGFYGIPRSVAIPRAEQLLKDLGIYDKAYQPSRNLSGGMKRRLMIARALIHHPRILILDEPTAGVDVELRRGMWEYLKTLTEKGVTILMTTHYLEEAEQLCDRIAIINKGTIIKEGTTKELLSGLTSETLILDLSKGSAEDAAKALGGVSSNIIDKDTLEIELNKEISLTSVFNELSKTHIEIKTARQKTNRLEELFVNLTSK